MPKILARILAGKIGSRQIFIYIFFFLAQEGDAWACMSEANYKVSMQNEVELREESAKENRIFKEVETKLKHSSLAQLVERSAVNR